MFIIHIPLWATAVALVIALVLELVDGDVRWHRQHPNGNAQIARDHEEQDQLEGRY